MRYKMNSKDVESDSSSTYSLWGTGGLQTPDFLKMIQNSNAAEPPCLEEHLSSLYSLDAASLSQKRKILDCEKDHDERFSKIQRKRQLEWNATKAHLVVGDEDSDGDEILKSMNFFLIDEARKKRQLRRNAAKAYLVVDDEDSDDEEAKMFRTMDFFERENEVVSHMLSWDSSDEDDDSQKEIISNPPVFFGSRSKWKEERRRLLKISMAKIRRVEDPESYLRRSVLINNTVKRLQDDVAMNVTSQSPASTSSLPSNYTYGNIPSGPWEQDNDSTSVNRHLNFSERAFSLGNTSSIFNSDTVVHFNDPSTHTDLTCNPVHFHLALASTFSNDRNFDIPHQEILPCSNINRNILEDQKLDISLPSIILKQPSSLHLFSSQPCGLQYRGIVQDEDSFDDFDSSHTSSILDSVVYHSLVASLET